MNRPDFTYFDRWYDEHYPNCEVGAPEAFAEWLSNELGETIIGGPVGEAPTVVATPGDVDV